MRRVSSWVMLLVMCLATGALAQEKFDAAAAAKTLAPFVNNRTVLVGHVDMSQADLAAAQSWIAEIMKKTTTDPKKLEREMKEMEGDLANAKTWLSNFSKAGGKHVFMIAGPPDFPRRPPLIIVPVAAGADKATLSGLILNGKPEAPAAADNPEGDTVAAIGDCLVRGNKGTLDRLKTQEAQPNPLVEKALAAAGTGTGRVVFVMSDESRKLLSQMLPPNLPEELGGGSTAVITDGIQFLAIGVNGPPNGMVQLTIQAKDADSAKALSDLLVKAATNAAKNKDITQFVDPLKVLDMFKPTVEGDKLLYKADQAKIDKFIDDVVIPAQKKMDEGRQAPPQDMPVLPPDDK